MTSTKSNNTLLKKETKNTKAATKSPIISPNTSSTENLKGNEKKSGCCMGTKECPPSTTNTNQSLINPQSSSSSVQSLQKGPKTRIVVKYDVGFNNLITIRGKGAGLSWDRGLSLKNAKADEWIWETDIPFTVGEFKVLINDDQYEQGENHTLRCGASVQYTPKF